jgi:hypothetical protein
MLSLSAQTNVEKGKTKPVFNKCTNERCFCSGNCKKIIGYEKEDGTIVYFDRFMRYK